MRISGIEPLTMILSQIKYRCIELNFARLITLYIETNRDQNNDDTITD